MNIRYKAMILGAVLSILLYSVTKTDWIERVTVFFMEKYAKNEHPLVENPASFFSYLKKKIEQHLSLGKTLEQATTQNTKAKTPIVVDQTKQYELLLWKIYAKALMVVVERKKIDSGVDVQAISTATLTQIVAKLQKKEEQPERTTTLVQVAVEVTVERVFAQLLAQHLATMLQNQTTKLSQTTAPEITGSIAMQFQTITNLAARYLPLMKEAQLSLLQTVEQLVPDRYYTILAENIALYITKINAILQQSTKVDTTLSGVVALQSNIALLHPFISLEQSGTKISININEAYQKNQQVLETIITEQLVNKKYSNDSLVIYKNLVTLMSYFSLKKQAEWAHKLQLLFIAILKPYIALCQNELLQSSFGNTVEVLGSKESTLMLTAADPGKKMPPSIQVLLLTLTAATHRCKKDDLQYKIMIENVQKSLNESAKEQQKRAIFGQLEELCTLKVQEISSNVTKTFLPNVKTVIQSFAIDASDITAFLQSIKQQKQIQNQLSSVLKMKGKLYQQKLAIFYGDIIQKFQRFVMTKYTTVQKLYLALSNEVQKNAQITDKKAVNTIISTWAFSIPFFYQQIKTKLQKAVLLGNTTHFIQLLTKEFRQVLPFLSSRISNTSKGRLQGKKP